ncbi:MAG: hypothetical protein GXX86_05610 [Propionibacterium sp.]|nr:hypothetical protein [Propionibacterium sp.]
MTSTPGRDLPSLVLIAGTRWDAGQWAAYHALLPDVRLITPDLPGHGRHRAVEFTAEAALAAITDAVATVLRTALERAAHH